MTAAQFRAWRKRLGLSLTAAGQALFKERGTIARYQRKPGIKGALAVPKSIEFMCRKLEEDRAGYT